MVSHGELLLVRIIKLNGWLTDNGVMRKDILFLDQRFLRYRIFCFGSASLGSCLSSILGYSSMLSSVFRLKLPEISLSPVIKDLIRSFRVETPVRSVRPPS